MDLDWSKPQIIEKAGKAVLTAPPTSQFWRLWKHNKFALKEKGLWKTHKAFVLTGLHSGFRASAAGCDEACRRLRHTGLCYSVVKERSHAS